MFESSGNVAPKERNALMFLYPALDALSDGRIIRRTVTALLRVEGVLNLLFGLIVFIAILKESFRAEGMSITIGGIVFAVVLAAAIVCVSQIQFYRANSVEALGESTFTVIPIVSILFRMVGECYAVFAVALGAGGCFFFWLAGHSPFEMLPLGAISHFFPTGSEGSAFVGGLLFLLWSLMAAFFVLIIFYFLAELTLVWADIARNIRHLRDDLATGTAKPASQAVP
jgi:hypothetical protein